MKPEVVISTSNIEWLLNTVNHTPENEELLEFLESLIVRISMVNANPEVTFEYQRKPSKDDKSPVASLLVKALQGKVVHRGMLHRYTYTFLYRNARDYVVYSDAKAKMFNALSLAKSPISSIAKGYDFNWAKLLDIQQALVTAAFIGAEVHSQDQPLLTLTEGQYFLTNKLTFGKAHGQISNPNLKNSLVYLTRAVNVKNNFPDVIENLIYSDSENGELALNASLLASLSPAWFIANGFSELDVIKLKEKLKELLVEPREMSNSTEDSPQSYAADPEQWRGHIVRPFSKGGKFDTRVFFELFKVLQYINGFVGFDTQSRYLDGYALAKISKEELNQLIKQRNEEAQITNVMDFHLSEYFRVVK